MIKNLKIQQMQMMDGQENQLKKLKIKNQLKRLIHGQRKMMYGEENQLKKLKLKK